MRAWLSSLLYVLLGPSTSDVLEPRPRVTPDPELAEQLERRRAELDYQPTVNFYRDQVQERVP